MDMTNTSIEVVAEWRLVRDSNPCSAPAADGGDVENRSLSFDQPAGREAAFASPGATTPSSRAPERDGCGCPPWVQRCVHFGEYNLTLESVSATANCLHAFRHHSQPFGVWKWKGSWQACIWNDGGVGIYSHQTVSETGYDSEADATAAFYAAEEALLAGGDA